MSDGNAIELPEKGEPDKTTSLARLPSRRDLRVPLYPARVVSKAPEEPLVDQPTGQIPIFQFDPLPAPDIDRRSAMSATTPASGKSGITLKTKVIASAVGLATIAGGVILGVDISHYQAGAKVANYNYVIAKVTEGTYYRDTSFSGFAAQAKKAGKPFGAYHYAKGGTDAYIKAQAAFALMALPDKNIPIELDCEWKSGCDGHTVHLWISELRRLGGRSTLIYMPKAYWQSVGSPNLGDIKGVALWNARYPGGAAYPGDNSSAWNGYGGLPVRLWQYSDSGNLDRDAFKGTSTQLCQYLRCYGTTPAPKPTPKPSPAPSVKPSPAPKPTPNPKPTVRHSKYVTNGPHRTVRLGDHNDAVRVVQQALGIHVDGKFGPQTLKAVKRFQTAHARPSDGIVGKKTWAALYHYGR